MTHASKQRGAALLTAMVIVTLVTTVASAMIWQQWRAIQVEAAERTQTQAQWILNGALDWARLILREDARAGGADHLGEPWAMPLAEARLSTFLAAERNTTEDAGPDAFLSGAISDAQARYNLRNLVLNGKIVAEEQASLLRLCEFVGVSAQTGTQLIQAVTSALLATPSNTPTPSAGTSVPLLPPRVEHLSWLKIDPIAVTKLAPHLVLLPRRTSINLNTASKEVIAAIIPDLDLASAQRLVQVRQRTPLKTLDALVTILGRPLPSNLQGLDVRSNYFEIVGSLRLDELIVSQRSLVERVGLEVRILSVERVGPGVLMLAPTPPPF